MTEELLAATLRPWIEGGKSSRVAFAALSRDEWRGRGQLEVSGKAVQVRYCRSMLEMRENLCSWDRSIPLAMLTPVEDHLLAADLRARLYKRQVVSVNVWTVLESHLGVRFIEGKLRTDSVLGDALLGVIGGKSVPPPLSGVLHEETVWNLILPARFGISSATADLKDLLVWARSRNGFDASDPKLRERLIEFFSRKQGPAAKALFDCYSSGADPLVIGLAFEPLLADAASEATRTDLARAFGRMERFTANHAVTPTTAREWHEAAQGVMAGLRPSDASEVVDGVDRVLTAVGADAWAHLSRWSRVGAAQALDRFAGNLTADALKELKKRNWTGSDARILDRAEMALRLSRWLATADAEWPNFSTAVDWYRSEGSWVDWARSRLRFVSESSKWNAVLADILDRARLRRETQNRRFAAMLATWTRDGSPAPAIAVEGVLETVVAPLAEIQPVLLIVMDGMSLPIARELESELTSRRWAFWSATEQEWTPAVSVLPSVTQFSRASLLAGRLVAGAQDVETRSFTALPRLKKPVLFHKNDLAPASDEVIRAVADPDRRVVGIVINAIDDELAGSRQVSPEWTLEYLAVLRGVLAEAATAGRVVVITSDHGHVLDTGSTISRTGAASSDRWRAGNAEGDDEFAVGGPRVLAPGGSFVGLAVESARYLRPKVGYHGGLTPQECLVPVMILAQPSVHIRGWSQISHEPPVWWSETVRTKSVRQAELFAPAKDWVSDFMRSEVFQSQLANTGGRVAADHVESTVRALDSAGGRLLKSAFATRVGITPGRVSSFIAAGQRVLNVDGYGVLELDEASQTVTLNRALLMKQFQIG